MALNWINPEDYSFNSFLLMERFQIHLMLDSGGWRNNKDEWKYSMGVALNANPAVKWYFERMCPECVDVIKDITSNAPTLSNTADIRRAEIYALASVEDFVTHTTPEIMATNCHYIRAWDKDRLYELADFRDKIVLDIGAGSGRLTFAAAALAKEVYASEPVETMRDFIRNKAKRENIKNVRVTEALITSIPYPDNSFDIVMQGHVVGDDWDAEITEMTRVCKSGGWLLDCPGDETPNCDRGEQQDELVKRGWEKMHYIGNGGGNVYRYRRQVWKTDGACNRPSITNQNVARIEYHKIDDNLLAKIADKYGDTAKNHIHTEDGSFSLAALHNGVPVGFISTYTRKLTKPLQDEKDAYIDIIEVDKSYRRQGIARHMVNETEKWAAINGFSQICAWSSQDKIEAIPMWRALQYGLCPATIWLEWHKVSVDGYYVVKQLTP